MRATADIPLPPHRRWLALASIDRGASRLDRRAVSEFDACEIGRDAYPVDGRGEVGIGTAVAASTWFAFYVIAVAHSLAFGH
jgi:hypothetical protein